MPIYSGKWKRPTVMQAEGAGNWPKPPLPAGLWSWGKNDEGQLGLGNSTNYSNPQQVDSGTTWKGKG